MRLHRTIAAASTALMMALTTLAAPCAFADNSGELVGSASTERPELFVEEPADSPVRISIDHISPRVVTTENTITLSGTLSNQGIFDVQSPILTVFMQEETPHHVSDLSAYFKGLLWDGTTVYQAPLNLTVPAGHSRPFSVEISRENLPLLDLSSWGPRGLTAEIETDSAIARDRSVLLWDSGVPITPAQASVALTWTGHTAPEITDARPLMDALTTLPGLSIAVEPDLLPTDSPQSGDKPQSGAIFGELLADLPQSEPSEQISHHQARYVATHAKEIIALLPGDASPDLVAATSNPALIQAAIDSLSAYGYSPQQTHPNPPTDAAQSSSNDSTDAHTPQSVGTSLSDTVQSATSPSDRTVTAPIIRNVLWPRDDRFFQPLLRIFPHQAVIAPASALQPEHNVDFTPAPVVAINRADGTTSTVGHTPDTSLVLSQYTPAAHLLAWEGTTPSELFDRDQLLGAIGALSSRENDSGNISFFAAIPRNERIDADTVQRAQALLAHRWIRGIPLEQMMKTPATDVARTLLPEQNLSFQTIESVATLDRALRSVAPLTSAVEQTDELNTDIYGRAFHALTSSYNDADLTRETALIERHGIELSHSIHAEPSVTVNLINKTAHFPVRVTNTLPWDANVTVTLAPSDPRLRVSSTTPATIPANSTQTVEVPVTAIGAGDIDVTYIVRTPDGALLDSSQTVDVRLRAGWEDALTATFGIIIAVAFVGGLIRTIRRRLKAHDAPGTGGPILQGMIPVSDYLDRKEKQ